MALRASILYLIMADQPFQNHTAGGAPDNPWEASGRADCRFFNDEKWR